jgi:uncharacterized protein (TIGR02452 family)
VSLRQAALDTLALLESGEYVTPTGQRVDVAAAQAAAIAGTQLYTPPELEALVARRAATAGRTQVTVSDETTQEAARRLVVDEAESRLVLLNFASARNHGGGFINGAKAQEEDLCRCSGLYPTLLVDGVQDYYAKNRAQKSLLYTDHLIYSPAVPWFRVRGRGELLESFFLASVITAPAPNAGPLLRQAPDAGPAIRATFRRRWAMVLAVAEAQRHRTVLLGAWGCGAFGNDPKVAAETLGSTLRDARFAAAFDRVVVAIPNRGAQGERNHREFRAVSFTD